MRDRLRHLCKNWRLWWRYWSVRLAAVATFIAALPLISQDIPILLWNMMPGELKDLLPPHFNVFLSLIFFSLAIPARFVKQKGLQDERQE